MFLEGIRFNFPYYLYFEKVGILNLKGQNFLKLDDEKEIE